MAKPVKHGTKWRIRWLDEVGNRKSQVYRSYKDAELSLRKMQIESEEIKRGLRPKPLPKMTFSELCDYYLKYYSCQKRDSKDDESVIRKHLRPFFGHYLLSEVHIHVEEFKISRMYLDIKTVHNLLTMLITMLRVAHQKNWILQEPKIKKPKIARLQHNFRYLKSKEEIKTFLKSAAQEGPLVFCMYATAIFTGMRAGELAGLQWSDVCFDKRLISVQRSYNGPTKNGEARTVPIVDVLYPILLNWKHLNKNVLVFPNQNNNFYTSSSRVFQETLHRVLDRCSFPKRNTLKRSRYIVFHDLRHTFASLWMAEGGNLFKLQHVLGHKSADMTLRYAHLSPSAFVEDYGRFKIQLPALIP